MPDKCWGCDGDHIVFETCKKHRDNDVAPSLVLLSLLLLSMAFLCGIIVVIVKLVEVLGRGG